MYTSFTNEELIAFCVENEFKENSIRHLRHFIDTRRLADIEAVVHVKNGKAKVLRGVCSEGNEWRINFITQFIEATIKQFDLQLDFKAILNMDDGIPVSERYTRLTWGRHRDSNHICIPDPFICLGLVLNRGIDAILAKDIPWAEKLDKIVFRGSDTGKTRANMFCQRLQLCHKYLGSDFFDAKLTNYAHYNPGLLAELGVDKDKVTDTSRDNQKFQLGHKYICYIHGNSVSPERLAWHLACNSLTVQPVPTYEEEDVLWFSSFMTDRHIVPRFRESDFVEQVQQYLSVADTVGQKVAQQKFAEAILNIKTHLEYLRRVLLKYNEIYNS